MKEIAIYYSSGIQSGVHPWYSPVGVDHNFRSGGVTIGWALPSWNLALAFLSYLAQWDGLPSRHRAALASYPSKFDGVLDRFLNLKGGSQAEIPEYHCTTVSEISCS